jgi:hypothetical protein
MEMPFYYMAHTNTKDCHYLGSTVSSERGDGCRTCSVTFKGQQVDNYDRGVRIMQYFALGVAMVVNVVVEEGGGPDGGVRESEEKL